MPTIKATDKNGKKLKVKPTKDGIQITTDLDNVEDTEIWLGYGH